jgi:hypothetical protein
MREVKLSETYKRNKQALSNGDAYLDRAFYGAISTSSQVPLEGEKGKLVWKDTAVTNVKILAVMDHRDLNEIKRYLIYCKVTDHVLDVLDVVRRSETLWDEEVQESPP